MNKNKGELVGHSQCPICKTGHTVIINLIDHRQYDGRHFIGFGQVDS